VTAQVSPEPVLRRPVEVEGTLYALNLHTGRYVIQDDAGTSVAVHAKGVTPGQVASLLGHRVSVSGTGRFDPSGRVKDIEVESIGPAAEIKGFDPDAFEHEVELDELLRGVSPIGSVDELVIEGLTEDEIDSLVRSLGK